MVLVVDVGNTNVVVGLFKGQEFINSWRLTTQSKRTSDEFGMFLYDLLKHEGVEISELKDVIISSVVPDIMYSLTSGILKYIGI